MPYNAHKPITIYAGDDYKTADNRSLRFIASETGVDWPTLTTSTIELIVTDRDNVELFATSADGYDTDPPEVLVEIDATDTTLLTPGERYDFALVATLANTNVITICAGTIVAE